MPEDIQTATAPPGCAPTTGSAIPEIRANNAPWMRAIQLLIMDGDATAEPIVMKKRDPGIVIEPSISISRETAQTLMDDLWNCGLRPTEGTGSAGALAATQNHLKDMQRLVFEPRKVS